MNHIDDLICCDDETFIWNCYRILFGRDPDPSGFAHHLTRLQNDRSRPSIIRSMKRSTEGRIRGARIKGLRWAIVWSKIVRIPGTGFLFSPFTWYRGKNDIARRIRVIETTTARLAQLAEENEIVTKVNKRDSKSRGSSMVNISELSPRAKMILQELKG
jgi:hypothetical protein